MYRKLRRLFEIRTRWEAYAVIYAIAVGAVQRGILYLDRFPGFGGWLLFGACTLVVFIVGGKMLDMTRPDSGLRRRKSDLLSLPVEGTRTA